MRPAQKGQHTGPPPPKESALAPTPAEKRDCLFYQPGRAGEKRRGGGGDLGGGPLGGPAPDAPGFSQGAVHIRLPQQIGAQDPRHAPAND